MGFRFRNSVRLAPGLRLNFGKRGTSLSLGGRGATLNLSKRGVRSTVGIPGTGLSYSTSHSRPRQPTGTPTNQASSTPGTATLIVGAIVVLFVLGALFG